MWTAGITGLCWHIAKMTLTRLWMTNDLSHRCDDTWHGPATPCAVRCGKSIFLRIIAGHTGLDSGEGRALTFFTPLPVLSDDVGLVFDHLA